MRGGPTFDEERFSINLARLKKGGENFEVVVDPDMAIAYKQGKDVDIRDVLKAEKVWSDAKKGELASETHMKTVFETTDPLEVARKLLEQGEIQLTHEYREKLREAKRNKIVSTIHLNAINPTTGTVHPEERIRRAMDEAKIRIDELRTAEDQVREVVKQLQPILPLKFAMFVADVKLPATHAAKCYGLLGQYGQPIKEEWLNDGSLAASVELPAGRYNDFVDALSSRTHGDVQVTKHEKK